MREILFRGKTKSGEWHFGFFIKRRGIANIFKNGMLYEVELETVGQFAGKHDTNGKMIFEKDKIKWAGEDTIYTVEFEGGSFICVSADTVFNLSDYADCEYELI